VRLFREEGWTQRQNEALKVSIWTVMLGPPQGWGFGAADFYARVVATHGALCDQDHPPCIMYSATQVPDRTAFLLENGSLANFFGF